MMRAHARAALIGIVLAAAFLAGCSSTGGRRGGGYYQDDGPDAHPPSNLDSVPDAVPRIEPYASGANKPYVVFGKRYVPDTDGSPYRKHGKASWYGKKFHGHSTAIGEKYDMYSMTAAHTTLPIPSYARVTSDINGKSVIVRVNDRGPFHSDRIMDLSYAAANKLGIIGPGSGNVTVEALTPPDIRRMLAEKDSAPAPSPASATESLPLPGEAAPPSPPASAGFGAAALRASPGAALATLPDAETEPAGSLEPRPLPPPPGSPTTLASPASGRFTSGRSPPGGSAIAESPAAGSPSNEPFPARAPATGSQPRESGTPAAGAGSIYLQFGAFGTSANAQSLVARLGRDLAGTGMPAAQVEQAGGLYKVSVGPYPTREAAQTAQQTASGRTGLPSSVVTH